MKVESLFSISRIGKSFTLVFCLYLVGCGGGSSTPRPPSAPSLPPFVIATNSLPDGRTNQTYSASLQTSGGSGAISWSISQGSLPPDLQLDSNSGKIEGTPTTEGSSQFTVRAQDSSTPPRQTTKSFSVSVLAGLVVVTATLPDAVVGIGYEVGLEAQNGEGTLTWTIMGGALPGNMDLTSDGRLQGSVGIPGDFAITVQVQDSSSTPQTTQKDFTLTVASRLLVQVNFVPGFRLNLLYDSGDSFFADGGILPYRNWRIVDGTLPTGLALDPVSGRITGTPTEEREAVVTVAVDDSTNPQQSTQAQIAIKPAEPLVFSQFSIDAIQDAKIGRNVRVFLNAFGGTIPYTWEASNGTLPPGINVFSFGEYSGVPTQSGTYSFSLKVTDNTSPPQTVEEAFTVRVDDLVISTQLGDLPVGVITQSYAGKVQATGGTQPYNWTISPDDSGFPPGLSFDSVTGEIIGTPTVSGTFTFDVLVVDSSTPVLTDKVSTNILIEPLPNFVTKTLEDGIKDFSYRKFIQIEGGLLPHTISLVSGALPDGVTVATGTFQGFGTQIEGTPVVSGDFTFTLQVSDGSSPPLTATQDFTLRVNDRLLITTESLPDAIPREFYNAQLNATGGLIPYTWNVSINRLPNGLSLDPATGVISGFTVTAETSGFEIELTDSSNLFQRNTKSFTIVVPFILRIATSRLPDGTVGTPYRVAMVTNDRVGGAKTWSLLEGFLPAGLTLDSTSGEILGEVAQAGTSTFTVKVQDVTDPTLEAIQILSLTFRDAIPRNDTIASATPISNGWTWASISPYSDPPETARPDTDYFELTAFAGAIVELETFAPQSLNGFGLDTVIEILDVDGNRFVACKNVEDDGVGAPIINDTTGGFFDDLCINDDGPTRNLNSFLEFRVPGSPGTPVTFYVHVLDFRGDARPDFVYTIKISGAN